MREWLLKHIGWWVPVSGEFNEIYRDVEVTRFNGVVYIDEQRLCFHTRTKVFRWKKQFSRVKKAD